MSMTFAAKRGAEPMMEMNMTPLIDVMLVMIIMMIITIPKQNHSIDLTMPHAGHPDEDSARVTIDIDFDGAILWNGESVSSRQDLERKMTEAANADRATIVQVRPNRLAEYKSVAAVMAMAQRSHLTHLAVTGNT